MRGGRTDRILRWIERGLVAVGASCLLWVAATSLSAIVYQAEHNPSLERVGQFLHRPEADLAANAVRTTLEAGTPIGRLEIPRKASTVRVGGAQKRRNICRSTGGASQFWRS